MEEGKKGERSWPTDEANVKKEKRGERRNGEQKKKLALGVST